MIANRNIYSRLRKSSAVALLMALATMVGCGGGGGGSAAFTARGQVQLPAGFTLQVATLTSQTGFGAVPLASDGQFSVEAGQASPSLVQIVNAAGKAVMVAFADPSSSAPTQIGPRQMADALVYFQLGGFMLPPNHTRPLLRLIDADPNVATVTAAITASMIANPTALADDDPQIVAAVGLAAKTIAQTRAAVRSQLPQGCGATLAPTLTGAHTISMAVRSATRGNGPLLLISPNATEQQSGVQVQQNPAGSGIIVTNNFRRDSEFYVYQTGFVPSTAPNNPVMYGTAKDTTAGQPFSLAASSTLGAIELLKDAFTGGAPWTPVSSAPIDLPLVTNSVKTFYEIVVINPSIGQSTVPAVFSDPRYAPYVGQWKRNVTDQTLLTFMKDVLIPLIGAITGGFEGVYDVQKYVPNEALWLQKYLPGTLKEITDGQWEAALEDVLNAVKSSDVARNDAIAVFKDIMRHQAEAVAQLEKFAQYIGAYKLIDAFLKFADVAAVVTALLPPNNPAEVWSATVFQPNAHLNPGTANVSTADNIVVLSATVPGSPDLSQFRFVWTTSGTQGHLEKALSSAPLPTGQIPDTSAAYVADLLKLKNGVSDTVSVTVFSVTDLNTPIGSATSTITGAAPIPPPPDFISVDTSRYIGGLWGTGIGALSVSPKTVTIGQTITVNVSFSAGDQCTIFCSDAADPTFVDGVRVPVGSSNVNLGAIQDAFDDQIHPTFGDFAPDLGVSLPLTPGGHSVTFTILPTANFTSYAHRNNPFDAIRGPWVYVTTVTAPGKRPIIASFAALPFTMLARTP